MDEYKDYGALVRTTRIEDITSSTNNQNILRRLMKNVKMNDLWISDVPLLVENGDYYLHDDDDDDDLGWLGYYIGRNASVKELHFDIHIRSKPFYNGLSQNTTIQALYFWGFDLMEGEIFRLLNPFFKNNHNLNEIRVDGCEVGEGCGRQLSLALGVFNKSLKQIGLSSTPPNNQNNQIGNGHLLATADLIVALSMHPQLEAIDLQGMSIGRNECTALVTLLQCTTRGLQKLNLSGNNIDNEKLGDMIRVLANGHQLRELCLGFCRLITTQGWKALSTLLEGPKSTNLETLFLPGNNFGDDVALMFANALYGNCKLKRLFLHDNPITAEGWASFLGLICDVSSVNTTYLSNHTLQTLLQDRSGHRDIPVHGDALGYFLDLNRSSQDKEKIARIKILMSHPNMDMEPLFEWDSGGEQSLKALPYVIDWFDRAGEAVADEEGGANFNIDARRLSSMYQFAQAMPLLFVPASRRRG